MLKQPYRFLGRPGLAWTPRAAWIASVMLFKECRDPLWP